VSQGEDASPADAESAGHPDDAGWRGVAAEQTEQVSGSLAGLLRRRSRRLLGSLLRPHKRAMWGLLALVVVENLAAIAGPYLIGVGIDRGIPPLTNGQGAGTLLTVVAAFVVAAVVQVVTQRLFLLRSGLIGQDVVLDLRTRLFEHLQRLSISFHED
jgi:ATP-binding cassette, subfamily B, bacterial